MAGATIVSNPHAGIEQWFEPGSELVVVDERRRSRFGVRGAARGRRPAEQLGRAARERALDEHTYVHRARRLLELLEVSVPTTRSESGHGA